MNCIRESTSKYNEILLTVNVSLSDIDNDIYFICDKNNNTYYSYDSFNDKNCEVIIDNKKVEFCKCFKFDKSGIHNIVLKLKEKIKTVRDLFFHCKNIVYVDMSKFNCENLISTAYLFARCSNLNYVDFTNFDTSKVTTMCSMFYGCNNLKYLNLSSFNTNKVKDLSHIFSGCENLKCINMNHFITDNVQNISYMFRECISLSSVNLGGLEFKNLKTLYNLFYQCFSLSFILFDNKLENCIYGDEIFFGIHNKGIFICNFKNKHEFFDSKYFGKRWKIIKQ